MIRRTAIVVVIFGTAIAAFVGVLSYSRGLADKNCGSGAGSIYLSSGRQLCGQDARQFCLDTQKRRRREDVAGARTCAGVLRKSRPGPAG